MYNQQDSQYDFGKNPITYEGIVLHQLFQIKEALNEGMLDKAETMLRVLKALLGETKDYKQAINLINERYFQTKSQMSAKERENLEDFHRDYLIEHLEIIRELLKARRFALVQKTDVML